MDYRQLGSAGLCVSTIGLGGTTFGSAVDEAQTARIIHQALDLGINFFDASAAYANGIAEEYIGRAVAGRRSDAIISTRLAGGPAAGTGPNQTGMARRRIIEGVHAALRRLNTDYIDLFQGQPPASDGMKEMLRVFDDLVRDGKIRYLGGSNYSPAQIVEAQWTARASKLTPYVSLQARYNLLARGIERDLLPLCQQYGVGIIPYTPLASGFLTGKYRRGEAVPEGVRGYNNPSFRGTLTDRNFAMVEALEDFAAAHGHTVGELALAWLLARPGVCSIFVGATRPEQVEENAKAADWKLTADDLTELDRITRTE